MLRLALRLCPAIAVLALGLVGCAPRQGGPAPVEFHGLPRAATAPAPPPSAALSRVLSPDKVTVAPGETVYGLAQRYRVPVRSLIEANGLRSPYRLAAGSILVLPRTGSHVVRPGETLEDVARLHHVEVSTLASTNDLAPPYVLRGGQSLVLPAPVETARSAPPLPASAPPPATPTANAPAPAPAPAGEPLPRVESAALPSEPPPPSKEAALGEGFVWPVRGRILSGFGLGANGTQNDGINIAAPAGTPVLAAEAGVVAYAGNELRGYGYLVLIKHDKGFMTAYAHNAALLVQRGDHVRRGQPIAKVGATGAVQEPQLHFEIRRGIRALDPTGYLPSLSAAASR
jgi:murein DD-endopeptidase MepM/ murein hydrolase activator NlpD